MKDFDIGIIGGGILGSAIAFELSKYQINAVVFEKGSDVASGTSKANSGVIHSGINSLPGSLKATYCVQGNKKIQQLAEDLGFSLKMVGKYVIAKNNDEIEKLIKLKKIGIKNRVTGLKIVNSSEINEANVACEKALWVPTAGIVQPYEMTIVLAEHAVENNVKILLETNVVDIKKQDERYVIHTNKGEYKTDIIINSAGLNCRRIYSMLQQPDFKIYPCRGEYLVLDKKYNSLIHSMIYPVPVEELGVLGVHITPTIEGNILLGPSAEFIDDTDDKQTTKEMMKTLIKEAKEIVPAISEKAVIHAYSGIRCKLASEDKGGWADFKISESKINPGFISLIGIESPGITASPAIAEEIIKMISHHITLKKKNDFKICKRNSTRFSEMTTEKQEALIRNDESWGRIICRCEQITEAEVIQALSNPLGARSLSSVKYRCRAGMGRCQGGFCMQHIVRILEERFYEDIDNIKLKSSDSRLFYGRTREVE